MTRSPLSSLPGGSGAMAVAVSASTVVHAALLGLFLLGKSDPVAPPSAHVTVQVFTLPAGAPGSAPSLESASAQVAPEPPVQQAELTALTDVPPPDRELSDRALPEVSAEAVAAAPVPLETAMEAERAPIPDSVRAEAVVEAAPASLEAPPLPPRRPAAARMPAPQAEPLAERDAMPVSAAIAPKAAAAEGAAESAAEGSASSASAPGGPSHGAEVRPGGNPAPVYPELARQRDQEGRVVLRVTVGSDGRARDVRVLRSSGHSRLDRAAREAVERWRFEPARRAGRPVEGLLDIPVTFRLNRA